MNTDNVDNTEKIDCLKCKYFALTWEPKTPRACKFFGFKTSAMPSVTVYKSSGGTCNGFEKKETKK